MAMPMATNEFVEESSLPEGLMAQLLSLASKWGDIIDIKSLKMIHLSGGTANKVYRVSWPANRDNNVVRTVLVRIYGESFDYLFSRDHEIQNFISISNFGFGPKLLAHFPKGRIEEFIHAKTLLPSDLRDPEISALIAAKLWEFHNLDMPGSKKVILWDVLLRNLLHKAKGTCTPEHAKDFCLDAIADEINLLESELSQGYQDIRFCHNDAQYANIMIDEKTRNITLIDYEYAGYNPVAYDLANYFCEMAADYHSDNPHILNYDIYPDLEERQRFVRLYLSSAGHQPSEAEVEKLVHDTEKYTLAVHLVSGLWGITSYYMNNIDFDYIAFASQRFEQYRLKKPLLLGTMADNLVNPFQ